MGRKRDPEKGGKFDKFLLDHWDELKDANLDLKNFVSEHIGEIGYAEVTLYDRLLPYRGEFAKTHEIKMDNEGKLSFKYTPENSGQERK